MKKELFRFVFKEGETKATKSTRLSVWAPVNEQTGHVDMSSIKVYRDVLHDLIPPWRWTEFLLNPTGVTPESIGLKKVNLNEAAFGYDPVNHPPHYTNHPSGVECITITEHMNFCLGNAMKYIWRADMKGNAVEDLEKAVFYLNREIERRKKTDENV